MAPAPTGSFGRGWRIGEADLASVEERLSDGDRNRGLTVEEVQGYLARERDRNEERNRCAAVT